MLAPEIERDTSESDGGKAGSRRPLRIDPNARWKTSTAIRIGKEIADLPLEYYEDPVQGQAAMAEVRRATGLKMSTNMCVTSFGHIPEALKLKPIDVLLCDHHYFGGFAGCQALGPICTAAGWSMSQHCEQPLRRDDGRNDSSGGLDSPANHGQRYSLPMADRRRRHHRGAKAADSRRANERSGWTWSGGNDSIKTSSREPMRPIAKCGMRGRDDRTLMRRIEPDWTGELL